MKKQTTEKNPSPCVYKINLTAVFSQEIGKEELSDAVFECLKEKTRHLSLVNVNSVIRCKGDVMKKVKEEIEIAAKNIGSDKTRK